MAVLGPTTGTFDGMALAPDLQAACDLWPDRAAITFKGATITFAELGNRLGALAAGYRRMGIGPGDRVVCQLPNCPEHVMAMNAAWANGAIHVGTDNDLAGPELAWLVQRTEAAALLFQPRLDRADPLAPVAAVRAACPGTRIILHSPDPSMGTGPEGAVVLADLLAPTPLAARPAPPAVADDDTALLLLTSGTTGRPKAIRESLPHCRAKMQFFADAFGPGLDDVHLVFLPIGHVFGLRLALLSLLSGGRLVLLDRFSPEAALGLVGREGVTVLPGMPTHLRLLLDRLDPSRHDTASLRWAVSAAANLPRPLGEAIYERLGVEMLFVYGCSEGFTTLTTDRDEILAGSVGATVFVGPPGTAPAGTVAILDPSSTDPLPAGATGEIAFGARGPVRYWRAPDAATDGWYRTGDLGHMDGDGRVYVSGRLTELLNRGGLKVSPSEIETAIASHPGVADAAVVAAADPVLGEAICACIVPTAAGPQPVAPTLGALRSFLGTSLARHKLPDELCVLEHIPRTKIGKVDRAALAAIVERAGQSMERVRPR